MHHESQHTGTGFTLSASTETIERLYTRRAARFARRALLLRQRSNQLSHIRLAVFLIALACLAMALYGVPAPTFLFAAAAIFGAAFVFLIVKHRAVRAADDRYRSLVTINEQTLARVRREWNALPPANDAIEPADPPFARDLDLFGRSSLMQLLGGGGATTLGRRTLRGWLIEPAASAEIVSRQAAVAELAVQLSRRQRFVELGRRLGQETLSIDRFFAWAEAKPWLAQRPWLAWTARITPFVLALSILAELFGLLPVPIWQLVLLTNVAFSLFFARRMHELFGQVSSRAGDIAHYAELFSLLGRRDAQANRLQEIKLQLSRSGGGAAAQLGRLARVLTLADLRFSQLVHAVFQSLTMWDFHVLAAIERWQVHSGPHARAWFAALAQWDALAELSALAHDNPAWTFPTLSSPAEETLTGIGLGHPLLATTVRVVNDVTLGPCGTFLLVTGSNMSGKSTLLRSIGLNTVLAQAGGVVAARSLRLPPIVLGTSMRIEDSVADGTSLFMAELKRLKQVVDVARAQHAEGHQRRLLYLLDEILHGTNTAERQIAVRRVMIHLLKQGAIGAISTHDLDLAGVAPLRDASQTVHFQESFTAGPDGRRMTFDYRLRPGLAATTNALALLEIVGLDAPDAQE